MNRIQLPQDYKTFVFQTLLLQLVCVYHLTLSSIVNEPYRAKCSRISKFDVTEKDHVLSNHVIASHSVTSRFECAVHCVSDTRCKSYNYQYAGTDCQLNDATKTGLATSLTSQTGYTYFEHNANTKVGCRPNPCGEGSCYESCSGHIACDCTKIPLFKGLRCEEFDKTFLITSIILQNELEFRKKIASWIEIASVWKLCYKAPTNGWGSRDFHVRCDRKGPTIVIIRVGQSIFGGYSRAHWAGTSSYRSDAKAFLFSLRNNAGLAPFRLNVSTETGSHAIYRRWQYHATYGNGHDIHLSDPPNTNSHSNLGYGYKVPPGYQLGATDTKNFLAGSHIFLVDEIEVFYTSEDTLKENSKILKDHPSYVNQLLQWLNDTIKVKTRWRLCWRATRDGWKAKTFHDGCDTKGPTVTVVQAGNNYIFGGYTDKNWYRSSSSWITSASSFLFSLANSENIAPFKSILKPGEDTRAILTGPDGPVFGRGYDLSLADDANLNLNSRAAINISYQVPSTVSNAKTILAGSEYFSPTAVEIFYQASDDLLYHSSIMSQEPESVLITLIDFLDGITGWTICWRRSRDGSDGSTFHSGCDSKGTTLTIVKVGSYIFGGYTAIDWGSGTSYQSSGTTFIFSLRNSQGTSPFKASPTNTNYVYLQSNYGPTFGNGHDIHIGGGSYANIGYTYTAPVAMNDRKTFLAGIYRFTPTEVEVFYLTTY